MLLRRTTPVYLYSPLLKLRDIYIRRLGAQGIISQINNITIANSSVLYQGRDVNYLIRMKVKLKQVIEEG